MKPSQGLATAAALLLALGAMNAGAAELSLDQVSAMLKRASPAAPADFTNKDLSDLDLSRLDFRNARLRGVNFFASKLVESDFRGATLVGACCRS